MKSTSVITGHLLLVLQLLQAVDIATPASVIRCANGEYAEFEQLCGTNGKTDQMQSEICTGDNCSNDRANQPESADTKCIRCKSTKTVTVREAFQKAHFGNLLTSYCVANRIAQLQYDVRISIYQRCNRVTISPSLTRMTH